MTKLKTIVLCLVSAVLAVGLTLSVVEHSKHSASALTVVGPTQVAKGDLIEFKASVTNPSWFLSSTVYQWKVLRSSGEVLYRAISPNDIFLPAGLSNDTLWVVCSATNYHNYVAWGSATPLDIVVNKVVVGDGPSPIPPVPPGPLPPPPPPPGPTPVTEKLYAIAVFDNTTALTWTPDQLKLHNSTTVADAAKALNAEWKNYDKANPALADATWQASLSKVTLPALFLVNEKGHQYYGATVAGEADVVAQLKKLRGEK